MYPPLKQYGVSSGYQTPSRPDHAGVDIPCPTGTPLPALVDGTIAFEGAIRAAAAGYRDEIICILQADGYFIVYGHLSRTVVNNGQRVKRGDIIGYSGNTGYVLPKPRNNQDLTSGAHLHIEQRVGVKVAHKGILAYHSRDITPLLHNYGTNQGGAPAQDTMTRTEWAESIVRCYGDVIQGDPWYDTNRPTAFKGHVSRLVNATRMHEERYLLRDFMRDSGVLTGKQMKEHIKEDERLRAALQDSNTNLRLAFDKDRRELEERLDKADQVNQTLAAEYDEFKARHTDCQTQLDERNRELKQLRKDLDKAEACARPIDAFSASELIVMGLRKWLGIDQKPQQPTNEEV